MNILPRIKFCGVLTVLCSEIRHCAKRQNVSSNATNEVMPYYELTDRIIIPDDKEVIWRYLTWDKFSDLIKTNTLYFSKTKNFGEYNEGLLSFYDKDYIRRQNIYFFKDKWKEKFESEVQSYEKLKEITYINCWIGSDIESAHMWANYIDSENGLAIRTKTLNLKDCLRKTTYEQMIFLSKVHYFDPISEPLGIFNMIRLFSRKTRDFRPERETRAIIQLNNFENVPDNIRVPIDLNQLIEEIYFSPKATKDFKNQVKNLLHGTPFLTMLRDSQIKVV